jgi:hypothetical protein
MHIRNCHTQKTQPLHAAKKEEREREHVLGDRVEDKNEI